MMQIFVNTLLQFDSNNEETRIERVIWIEGDSVAIVNIANNDAPYFCRIGDIRDGVDDGVIKIIDEEPCISIHKEEDIPEKYKKMRDSAWVIIKDLVQQEPQVFHSQFRRKAIQQLSKAHSVSESSIYGYLKRYWKMGTPNALIPRYAECGGKGKERKSGNLKMGRPRKHKDITGLGINVTEEIKKVFRIATNKFYYTTAKNSLVLTYELMRKEYFSAGYKIENGVKIPIIKSQSDIPSFGQFRYWYDKNLDIRKSITSRYSNKKFQKQYRAITGTAMDGVMQPGTFEIDCQIADVYLVSRFNRNWIIGRPAIYACIDRFSHLITGIYVGFESGSYMGAAMCLVNCVADKKIFCKQYGIEIESEMWPTKHLPTCIVADRGELEGNGIDTMINSLNITVSNTPSYRADLKTCIERFFGLTNDRTKPFMQGVVDLDGRERGDIDYKIKANLDLSQFIQIIIKSVLFHNNNYVMNNYKREEGMISDNIPCIPIDLWNWGIVNKGGLRYVSEEVVKFALMPSENVTVTAKGIRFKDMYYASKSMLKEQIFVKARTKGSWKLKASYDPRNLSYIYVHGNKPSEYEKCFLLDSRSRYRDRTLEEIENLLKMEKIQKEKGSDSVAQAKTQLITEIENIVKQAEQDYKQEPESVESNRQRVKNIRENKSFEKATNRKTEAFELDKAEENFELSDAITNEESDQIDEFDLLMKKQKEGLSKAYGEDINS